MTANHMQGISPISLTTIDQYRKLVVQESDSIFVVELENERNILGRISPRKDLSYMLINPAGNLAYLVFNLNEEAEIWDLDRFKRIAHIHSSDHKKIDLHSFCNSPEGNHILVPQGDRLQRIPWNSEGKIEMAGSISFDWEIMYGISQASAQYQGTNVVLSLADEPYPERIVISNMAGEWTVKEEWEDVLDQISLFEQFSFSPQGKYLLSSFQYEPALIEFSSRKFHCRANDIGPASAMAKPKIFHKDTFLYWLEGYKLIEMDLRTKSKRLIFEESLRIQDYTWTPSGIFYSRLADGNPGTLDYKLLFQPF